ncbi:MAG: TIGR04283 family arsenosugar biosynthesis glycosyltransferase [Methylococcaceae bacterium]
MKFSIIIPTLNEATNIQPCLSALQPLRTQCEIIIVDGGSSDNTVKIANPLADKILISEKGRARQMNTGAQQASGKTLIFLHADTYLPNNALKQISQVNNGWGRFDIRLEGKSIMLKVIALLMNWRSRLTGIATGDQVIFVNKQLFEKVGGYPEIALMEDISLCSRLKQTSAPLSLKDRVTSSGRRWEQFGLVKTVLLMWSIRLRYFFGENPEILARLYSKGLFWKALLISNPN